MNTEVERGVLTKEVQEIAKKYIGREMTIPELELISYIQHVLEKKQKLDIREIYPNEMNILRKWKDAKLIECDASELTVTKPFWDFMCEVLFQIYVKQEEEKWKNEQ